MRLTYLQERLATGSLPLLVAFLIASALWWLPSADTAAATTGGLWDSVPGLLLLLFCEAAYALFMVSGTDTE